MLTTRHPTQPCPNCGYPLNSVGSALGDHRPEVGDLTVCIECVTPLTFEPGLTLRVTTTEELRALTWDHVDLIGSPEADPPVPPSIMVWGSVRAGGDTKTRKSRRTLALPMRCVEALWFHRSYQDRQRQAAGQRWHERGLVFASAVGTIVPFIQM